VIGGFTSNSNGGDELIEVEPLEVDRWCRNHLGSGIDEELFRYGHLSAVIGIRLISGPQVVVKIRRASDRLVACASAHRVLFERGFPCPEPLVDLEPFGEGKGVASAEKMIVGGDPFPNSGRSPEPFAEALAQLVALAPKSEELDTLDPAPPWTFPPFGTDLWPRPDDRDIDLNEVSGPAWIDESGWAARDRLQALGGPPIIGHGDWYTANLRWAGDGLLAAFDWDSVIAAPEPVIVGLAAAVYPATYAGTEASIDETEEFLDAYMSARARGFSDDELEQAWAAGLWNRSFDAKKQFATEGKVESLTEGESLERQRRAGVGRV
jgi:Phosphotransferase enzyme family